MAKLSPQQKRLRTLRRNQAIRAARRRTTPMDRLYGEGAHDGPAIFRRLLWVSQRRGISLEELPAIGDTVTPALVSFVERHKISLDWLICGGLADLRKMLRAERQPPSTNGAPEERAARAAAVSPYEIMAAVEARMPEKLKEASRRCTLKQDGTPDRRTLNRGSNPLRAKIIKLSDSVTIVGKVIHRRRGFDPATLSPSIRREWIATLEHGKELAQAMVYDFIEAQQALSG
jgi:hypothetical protein